MAMRIIYLPTPALPGSGVRVIPFGTSQHSLPWSLVAIITPHGSIFNIYRQLFFMCYNLSE